MPDQCLHRQHELYGSGLHLCCSTSVAVADEMTSSRQLQAAEISQLSDLTLQHMLPARGRELPVIANSAGRRSAS